MNRLMHAMLVAGLALAGSGGLLAQGVPDDYYAWWTGDGHTMDVAGSRNGAFVGSETYAVGMVDQAFQFNSNNYVAVPDDPEWTLTSTDFTWELWVKWDSFNGSAQPLVSHDDGGGNNRKWILWYGYTHSNTWGGSGNGLRFHINGPVTGPWDPVGAPWNPVNGQWYHVAITRIGNDYTLYLCGVVVGTNTDSKFLDDPTTSLMIGRAEGFWSNGAIDEVTYYKRGLSQAEIQAICNAGPDGKPTNLPPVADAGADQTLSCVAGGTPVSLTCTASDPNGDLLEYEWAVSSGSALIEDPTSATINATLLDLGPVLFTCTVTDGRGGIAIDDVLVTVVDETPPVLVAITDVAALWPPNHEMVPVRMALVTSDECDPGSLIVFCQVSSSEPDDALGDGTTAGDVNGFDGYTAPVPVSLTDMGDGTFQGDLLLRAERNGAGTGRSYSILCVVSDPSGNVSTASCVVVVPHDKRRQ